MPPRLTDLQLLDRSVSEDDLLTAVMGMFRALGWLAHHVRRSDQAIQMGDAGLPDIIAMRPPRLVVAELKKETGKATLDQMKWLEAFVAVGGEAYIWRPSDQRTGVIERILRGDVHGTG